MHLLLFVYVIFNIIFYLFHLFIFTECGKECVRVSLRADALVVIVRMILNYIT